ncbi:hypothetical protein [Mycobacterium spongiae]|uniref:Uncharacterized protein n=1 Tax=Mycobacterium spongiae TaxID=886343 RepID=A0A975K1U9_9MYCO|nr:hypothetical protein [Mycobacterium spongiae]QUR68588.1 hypothetical protein F6B93_17205 [Mycobacterium spongiae]
MAAKGHLPSGDAGAFADRVLGAMQRSHRVTGLVGADATARQLADWVPPGTHERNYAQRPNGDEARREEPRL